MILINKDKLLDLWPIESMNFYEKLNAVSRLVILLCLVGFVLTRQIKILISGIVTLGVLVFLYYVKRDEIGQEGMLSGYGVEPEEIMMKKKDSVKTNMNAVSINNENYYKLTSNNPLGNVLLPEIGDNPERKPAPPTFDTNIESNVNKQTQKISQNLNPSIKNIDKRLFQDLGDKFEFENSMINFNTMPSTTVPNAQGAFAEFCYGNMESCKDTRTPGVCGKKPPRVGSVVG
tara:strand:- start:165 stop:860 length:696 start_codon:yes stop_codon:yes gene_type:complete